MPGFCRINIVCNAIIDWISVSAEIAPKNIWLANRVNNFGWNLADSQKFRRRCGACYKISARQLGSSIGLRTKGLTHTVATLDCIYVRKNDF